jgi:hypothetical protein
LYPPREPIISDRIASAGITFEAENTISVRGAIFWIVARMAFVVQDRPSITWGSQKCRGAAPIFMIRAVTMIAFVFISHVCSVNGVVIIGIRNIAEARACVKKYFSIASLVVFLLRLANKGTNASVLISRPIQAENQDEEEAVITTPISMNAVNKIWIGMFYVLAWRGPL